MTDMCVCGHTAEDHDTTGVCQVEGCTCGIYSFAFSKVCADSPEEDDAAEPEFVMDPEEYVMDPEE